MPWNPEHYNEVKPKIIHTKTFSCANDHPIVWYTVDNNNKAMCEYCATHFVYESKDKIIEGDYLKIMNLMKKIYNEL